MSLQDEWRTRFPDFSVLEILSPDGLLALKRNALTIQPHALDMLQRLRDKVGPLYVNHNGLQYRGYRSPQENRRVGGAEFSYHMQGLAFDINHKGLSLDTLAEEGIAAGFSRAFIYRQRNFVHLDVRPLYVGGPSIAVLEK